MDKIITDNSKVNINLLNENELLKEQIEKLKLDKQALQEQLTLQGVVKSLPQGKFCEVCDLPTDGEKCYSKRCPI